MKMLLSLFLISMLMTSQISTDELSDLKNRMVPIKCLPEKVEEYLGYTFQAEDLKPSSVKLTITKQDSTQTVEFLNIDNNGFLRKEDGRKSFYVFNYGYGESAFISIEPCDQKNLVLQKGPIGLAHLIPHPLKTSDQAGHQVNVASKDKDGYDFYIDLSGFDPNEIIQFESISCHEEMTNTFSVDENGNARMLYSPAVIGETEGPFFLKFYNKHTELVLQHYWGKIAFTSPTDYPKLKKKFPQYFNIADQKKIEATKT